MPAILPRRGAIILPLDSLHVCARVDSWGKLERLLGMPHAG